jgi:hypothetical protein
MDISLVILVQAGSDISFRSQSSWYLHVFIDTPEANTFSTYRSVSGMYTGSITTRMTASSCARDTAANISRVRVGVSAADDFGRSQHLM